MTHFPLWNQPNIQLTPKPLISHTPLIFFIELSTEHFLEGSVVIISADLIFDSKSYALKHGTIKNAIVDNLFAICFRFPAKLAVKALW